MQIAGKILIVFIFLIMVSCYEENQDFVPEYDAINIETELKEEIVQAKNVFKHIYLPIEMSNMFKDIEADYSKTYLEDPEKVEDIVFSNEIALALGMYGVDLGYVRLFEQWNTANEYFLTLQTLAHKIGLDHNIYLELSEYFDKPVYSKDSIESLATKVYINVDYHLRQNGRDRASALVILGGWIESINIATKMYSDKDVSKSVLLQKILDQQASLNSVINLMISVEQDELITTYINRLKDMETLLMAMNITFDKFQENTNDPYIHETLQTYINKIKGILSNFQEFKY